MSQKNFKIIPQKYSQNQQILSYVALQRLQFLNQQNKSYSEIDTPEREAIEGILSEARKYNRRRGDVGTTRKKRRLGSERGVGDTQN